MAPPTVAFDLLLGLPSEPSPGLRWGATLSWLSQAATLAVELVARGRTLPESATPVKLERSFRKL